MLNEAALKKFRKLYREEYGIDLDKKDLIEKANRILNLYRIIYPETLTIKINKNHAKKVSSKSDCK